MVGTGFSPSPHSVDLAWNASPYSDIVGYNIYRGTQSGGPYSPITSALETSTTEIDNTVSPGQTYYYVVTAVNLNSQESAYSREVRVVIPFP
jgi:fibronectin type 3 domain-containing protein